MHRAEPHRMAGLDLYSTTLWHLKKEVELSYLAQQVTEFDKLSSEAWCVAGNCFSLQKEHDIALTFFQRVSSTLQNPSMLGKSHNARFGNAVGYSVEPVVHVCVHPLRT